MTRGQDGTVRLPFGNMRFRVEIDGISGGGAFEVVFPEARIAGRGRNGRRVLYGPLILRRGLTAACDWYDWWDTARRARTPAPRFVRIVLLDSEACKPLPDLLVRQNADAEGRLAFDILVERNFGAWQQADRDMRLADRRETSRDVIGEFGHHQLVLNLGRPARDMV